MMNFNRLIDRLTLPGFIKSFVLLWLCAAGVFLLLPNLGFYWDDWAIAWIYKSYGASGLERYFSTNRVYWGRIFQLSAWLVGSVPWRWQVYALFWRWAGALSAFWSLSRLMPRHRVSAFWVSCLLAVYPGYGMQPLAIFTAHFYIVITAYLLSLGLMAQAQQGSRLRRLFFSGLAFICAMINLVTTEYFFTLELLRPVLLWFMLAGEEPGFRQRLKQVFLRWLPYLLLFIAVVYWRVFIFNARPENFQSANYQMVFFQQLKQQPFDAIIRLMGKIAHDLWLVSVSAWQGVFSLPHPAQLGMRSTLVYSLLVLASAVLTFLAVRRLHDIQNDNGRAGKQGAFQLIIIGAAAMLLAGCPFWLTDLPVGLGFPNSRFTLPFMPGVSMLLAGLLLLLPLRHSFKSLLLCLLVGLAAGQSFRTANEFRRDWNMQKALFWQMVWRMPDIKPATTILANDWDERFYSDNSLTAPLNWIYASDNRTEKIDYMFYFPAVRLGYGLPAMQNGLPIEQNYLAAQFSGSTSQMIAVYYGTDACLRVLDPLTDSLHWSISPVMREAAALSNTDVIFASPDRQETGLPAEVFGAEPQHGWCYYFEKAELARQLEDWQQVARLGDIASNLSEHPNDPSERLVFIEGYAHVGNWHEAARLTGEAAEITPLMQPLLCRLWQRIDEETTASAQKTQTLRQVRALLACE